MSSWEGSPHDTGTLQWWRDELRRQVTRASSSARHRPLLSPRPPGAHPHGLIGPTSPRFDEAYLRNLALPSGGSSRAVVVRRCEHEGHRPTSPGMSSQQMAAALQRVSQAHDEVHHYVRESKSPRPRPYVTPPMPPALATMSAQPHHATLVALLRRHAPSRIPHAAQMLEYARGNEELLFAALLAEFRVIVDPADPVRAALRDFYAEFDPVKMCEVDTILHLAGSKRGDLLAELRDKYPSAPAQPAPPHTEAVGVQTDLPQPPTLPPLNEMACTGAVAAVLLALAAALPNDDGAPSPETSLAPSPASSPASSPSPRRRR